MDTARTGDVPAYGKNRPLLRAFGVEDRFLLADPIAAQPVPVAEQALDDAAAQSEGARAVALATTPVQTIPRLVQQLRYLTVTGGFGLTVRGQLTCRYRVRVRITSAQETM